MYVNSSNLPMRPTDTIVEFLVPASEVTYFGLFIIKLLRYYVTLAHELQLLNNNHSKHKHKEVWHDINHFQWFPELVSNETVTYVSLFSQNQGETEIGPFILIRYTI